MWYYASAKSGDYEGPFQEEFLGRKLRAGVLNQGTLVWREGFSEWLPLGETELIALLKPPLPWKTTPRYEPAPFTPKPGSPAPEISQTSEKVEALHQQRESASALESDDPLDDYEQRGFEQPQSRWANHFPKEVVGPGGRRKSKKRNPGSTCKSASAAAGDWKDLSGLTQVLSITLVISAIASMARLLQMVDFFGMLPRQLERSVFMLQSQSDFIGFLSILGLILFYVWLYRAIRNLPALGAKSLDLSPGLVVFSFYLPVLNWFLPFLAMRKLWRASFNPKHWPTQSVGLVVAVLWASSVLGRRTWIGSQVLGLYAMNVGELDSAFFRSTVMPETFRLISLLATIVFVNAVWRAQASARNLDAS